jgi:hypothetical protein
LNLSNVPATSHILNPANHLFFRATFGGEIRLPDAVVLLHTKDGIKYDEHQVCIFIKKLTERKRERDRRERERREERQRERD